MKIGVAEFLIKLGIYYVHERAWQGALKGKNTESRTVLYKTIVWRIIATTGTFIISGAILENFDEIALLIALSELLTKFILYYFHERFWLKIPLGKIRGFLFRKK